MARLRVLQYPDPALRRPAEPVTDFGPDLAAFAADLLETLYESGGIGLSASQVGDRRAIIVMDLSGDASDPRILVNPQIVAAGTPAWVEESCLSIPGVVGKVIRATRIEVQARSVDGLEIRETFTDMSAVCVQHEVDHLEGRLFIDRLPLLRRVGTRLRLAADARRRRGVPAAGQ